MRHSAKKRESAEVGIEERKLIAAIIEPNEVIA
jgi:hypothetical protein